MTNLEETIAGCEMDTLMAEKVMGWTKHHASGMWTDGAFLTHKYFENRRHGKRWSPSTDIAAAWEILAVISKRVYAAHTGTLYVGQAAGGFSVEELNPRNGVVVRTWGYADTAPLAICKAAREAVNA